MVEGSRYPHEVPAGAVAVLSEEPWNAISSTTWKS